jgi:hypothetical protein
VISSNIIYHFILIPIEICFIKLYLQTNFSIFLITNTLKYEYSPQNYKNLNNIFNISELQLYLHHNFLFFPKVSH